jgi:hypothetical protein
MRRIAEGRVNPRELATGTDQCPDLRSSASLAELGAYTVLSRALLNLDETITKE